MSFLSRLLCLLLPAAFAFGQIKNDRYDQGQQAAQTLLDIDFFANGRGMMLPPNFPPVDLSGPLGLGLTSAAANMLNDEFGLIVNNGQIVGFKQINYKGYKVGVIGCAMCHTGKAAGFLIPGLGNKNFDLYHTATVAQKYIPIWYSLTGGALNPDPNAQAMYKGVQHFLNEVGNPKVQNFTQSLVPTAIIRKWFFDVANQPLDDLTGGRVKVPVLWGYGEKRKVGSFADGFGDDRITGWPIAVELAAGQTAEDVRGYLPKIEELENAFAHLLPMPYPFKIDSSMAQKGEETFNLRCATCHGTYEKDSAGWPIYKAPEKVAINIVQTDAGRLGGLTPKFLQLVENSPLNDIIKTWSDYYPGYFAPRLVGIWSRFPYLHNGSVPTVFDLLSPPEKRPKYFSLRRAGELERFDQNHLGLSQTPDYTENDLGQISRAGGRWVYDTTLVEHGNYGHNFSFYSSFSDQDRLEIIEYLKTL